MELNVNRFTCEVSKHFTCPICFSVFNEPLQDADDHIFCKGCIEKWLARNTTCPIDRKNILRNNLKPVNRTLKNLLDELELTCDYKEHGCKDIVKLEALRRHVDTCVYNPTKMVTCPNGCELTMRLSKLKEHSCVKELKNECRRLQAQLETTNREWKNSFEQLKNEINKVRHENGVNRLMAIGSSSEKHSAPANNTAKSQFPIKFQPYFAGELVNINGVELETLTAIQCASFFNEQKYSLEEMRYQHYCSLRNVKK